MSFSERAAALVERANQTLDRALPEAATEPAKLHQALRYAVFNGGKRIRPLLSYAAAEALGLTLEQADAGGCAVELVHCYSLVHDDLPAMDDDDLRRGQPTVHRAFDEATAILVGDALLSLAFEVLASDGGRSGPVTLLARAAGSLGMVGGQAMDLAFETERPTPDALERMFRGKTGALIRAAVELPAAAELDSDDPARAALIEYADSIGLAFQIVDDLLDLEGSTEEIGKPAGSDVERGKATWPALFGVEASRRQADELMNRAWRALDRLPGDVDGLHWLGQRIVKRRS
ncbi:MAG: polyprenyl synthetase family protein [Wenzhouxiangellaceae bacterium]